MDYPTKILHWIKDQELSSDPEEFFAKINPATGQELSQVIKGNKKNVDRAVKAGSEAYENWSQTPIEKRAEILKLAAKLIDKNKQELAQLVALESGKPLAHALGEVEASVSCGNFISSLVKKVVDEPIQSNIEGRQLKLVRKSMGVGALIVPFNNPAASIAWKVFPALFAGNTVVIKSHELTPYIAIYFAKIFKQAGLPSGVLSVIQGLGPDVGTPLVENDNVVFISFTGSVGTGSQIIKASADRLAKVSIEAGGKNPLVVCDDADLDHAVETAIASGFVDGGQRCAATSRLIVFDSIYDKFKEKILEKVGKIKIGTEDGCTYGAIISKKRLDEILTSVEGAVARGAKILIGGKKIDRSGFFLEPTILGNVPAEDEVSCSELFGPVVVMYRVKDFNEALTLANNSDFKLTGAIHTKDKEKAQKFIDQYEGGVVRVNGPTHGSEPHVPFGGMGLSGNGWREPGEKALDFYFDWQQVSLDNGFNL